jgi:hypothetical protein
MIFPWKRFHVILFEEINTKLYIASLLNLKLKKKKITVRTNIFPTGNSNSYASLDQDNSTSFGRCSKPEREKEGERERESKTFLLTYLRTFDNFTLIFR